jgi:hypothetical protein
VVLAYLWIELVERLDVLFRLISAHALDADNLSSDQAKVSVVDAYFRAFAADQPKWDAYMDAAEATNALESMGISAAVGVPAPEQPQTVAPMEAAAS